MKAPQYSSGCVVASVVIVVVVVIEEEVIVVAAVVYNSVGILVVVLEVLSGKVRTVYLYSTILTQGNS